MPRGVITIMSEIEAVEHFLLKGCQQPENYNRTGMENGSSVK